MGGTGGSAGSGGTAGTGGTGGTGGTDMTAPTATIEPTTATLGKTARITIRFSEGMDTASLVLGGALGAESDGGEWETDAVTGEADQLNISPQSVWTSGPGRGLTVDARDLAGNALATLSQSYLVRLVFDDFQNAAVVVGQADFTGTQANQGGGPDANTLNGPRAPLVDNGRLFVGDRYNNRVLAFNALPTVNNASADFVLGQPDFFTTTAATTRSGMDGPQSIVTVDGKMVLTDNENNRVLIYKSIPTDGSALPDVVVGQPDFVTAVHACASDSLDLPATATVTPGGKLIVTDSSNNRVLIWNALPTTNRQPADTVLGQGVMTLCTENDDNQDDFEDAPTARTLNEPTGVWADDTRLVVVDTANSRVLIWTAFPTADFQPADLVLGQSDFTKNTWNDDDQDETPDASPTARTMAYPDRGVHSNGEQLVVTDTYNNRTLIWNNFPTTSFQPADTVLGQFNFTNNASNDDNQDGTPNDASARTQAFPYGPLLYQDKLLVADSDSRLLIYQSQ
jgi:hypothetical protein